MKSKARRSTMYARFLSCTKNVIVKLQKRQQWRHNINQLKSY